jgi:carbonic anhydrase/acetyltransferase-like protein (isoleucine patch superfamily)
MFNSNKKYKLIKDGSRSIDGVQEDGSPFYVSTVYRLKALRDIPEHGVKTGDLGGLVTDKTALSHTGSCWIGEGARVIGWAYIQDSAYIYNEATIVNQHVSMPVYVTKKAKISGSAFLVKSRENHRKMTIGEDAVVSGQVKITDIENIVGSSSVQGYAVLDGCQGLYDKAEVSGHALVGKGVVISGSSKVSDDAIINDGVRLTDVIVRGKAEIGAGEILNDGVFEQEGVFVSRKRSRREIMIPGAEPAGSQPGVSAFRDDEGNEFREISITDVIHGVSGDNASTEATNKEEMSVLNEDSVEALALFNEIKESIDSYESDIVKLIKYPVMTDGTNAFTMKMVKAFKLSKRLSSKPESERFIASVAVLEDAFIAAESNALKIASSLFSEEEAKKAQKAKDLFRIASNEASTEQEKKVAFIQGFKALEGVLVVPEVAVDAFRIKIGLQELETLVKEDV